MNLLWLLLTVSLFVPENGTSRALDSNVLAVSEDANELYVASSNQELASDEEDFDEGSCIINLSWARSRVLFTRFFVSFSLSRANYSANLIRAPPVLS